MLIESEARSPLYSKPLFDTKQMNQPNTENQYLISKVEDFYLKLKNNQYRFPIDRARALEALSNLAWDEVDDELYQSAIRIDP